MSHIQCVDSRSRLRLDTGRTERTALSNVSISRQAQSLREEFCDVMARLKSPKVEVNKSPYKLNDAAEIWRNSSVLGLAQFVLQMISEFELSLMEKGAQRDEILNNMAEQRCIKKKTLSTNHVKPSGEYITKLQQYFVPELAPVSFVLPPDPQKPTPWAIIIVLIALCGMYSITGSEGRGTDRNSPKDQTCYRNQDSPKAIATRSIS